MSAPDLSERVRLSWQSVRRARHSARLPRYLTLTALLIFSALGLRSAFFAPAAITAPIPPLAAADQPSHGFALSFARAYLTHDAAHPGRRARALAPYIGGPVEPEAGFLPTRGAQSVLWTQVASDQPALQGGRVLTVAAGIRGEPLPTYLAVTVEHRPGGPLRLVGYPALVGAPAIAPPSPPPAREAVDDPALTEVIDRVLRNYLAGAASDLEADLAPEARVTLPTRRLQLEEVAELLWLGEPGSGAVLATLLATDHDGATYTLSYELGIAHRERPYVDFIEVVPTDT